MPSPHTVSQHLVAEILRALRQIGFDNSAQTFIDPATVCRQPRVSIADVCGYLAAVARLTQDPNIGFRLGELIEPSCFNLVGHLVMSCPSIGVAMPLVNRFQHLVMDCADSEYWVDQELCHFTWTPKQSLGEGEKVLVDLVLSAIRCFGVWATGVKDPFTRVYFQYPEPEDTSACFRIFGHAGEYGCDKNGFSYPLCWNNHPVKSANEDLQPMILEQAQRSLENLRRDCPIVAQLSEVLTRLLPQGYPSMERVAAAMNASSRTLQRHLKRKGTSYSEVLQQVRLNRANFLLRNTRLSLAEVATSVGYREQSSFSYAYKSWVGMTPIQFRHDGRS